MKIRVQKNLSRFFIVLLFTGYLVGISGCATTKDGDYYVRNHHNDNMTRITVKDGEIIENEITFQQYIEETKK